MKMKKKKKKKKNREKKIKTYPHFECDNRRRYVNVDIHITSILGCEMFESLICILGCRTIMYITKLCKYRYFLQYYKYFLER